MTTVSEINNKLSNSTHIADATLPKTSNLGIGTQEDYDRSKVATQLRKLASIYSRMADIMSNRVSSPEGERIGLAKEASQIVGQIPGGYGLNGLDVGEDGELLELRLRCYEAEADLGNSLLSPQSSTLKR